MKSAAELEKNLMSINRRSYPAYKDLRGSYQFQGYQLNIDHVQGDPFASPSKLSIQVKKIQARFPEEYYKEEHRRIALQDYLTRQFGKAVSKFIFQAKGSGKSGLIGISRCGQEVLDRTAFEIKDGDLLVRFEVGFPANGRTINAFELRKILFEYLPEIADRSLYYKNLNQQEVKKCIELAEDQHYIRRELTKRRLIAFVANGSILPRESGVSQKPMKGAIAFEAPESMEVEMELPHRGKIKGMGIPEGITLIVGGGYHGKSTLLKALEQGISIILVAGSSGSYFYIADHVLQMDNYRTYDITEKVKTVIGEKSETGEKKVPVDVDVLFDKDHHRSLKAGKMEKKRDQVKIKQFGKDSFSIGRENVDLKYVEQILDAEQTTALAYCLKNLLEEMERKEQDVDLCVEKLWSQIKKQGLASLCKGSYVSVAMAQIRKQDIYACLNRYRGFIV